MENGGEEPRLRRGDRSKGFVGEDLLPFLFLLYRLFRFPCGRVDYWDVCVAVCQWILGDLPSRAMIFCENFYDRNSQDERMRGGG